MKGFFIYILFSWSHGAFLTGYYAISFLLSNTFYQVRHSIWLHWVMKLFDDTDNDRLGDEAPRLKDLVIVLVVVGLLTFLSWLTYYKLGWFH